MNAHGGHVKRPAVDSAPLRPRLGQPKPMDGASVRDEEHHVQDAAELYAVARLQEAAEQSGRYITYCSDRRWAEFLAYLSERGLSLEYFETGRWSVYGSNADTHLPTFFDRLARYFPSERFDFVSVEAEYRNQNRKGDFVIFFSSGVERSVSLKNYRGSAKRPQVCSGTFNSFIINFLFEADGVGWAVDPMTGRRFRGSDPAARDDVLFKNGFGEIVPHMAELDVLNSQIKARFVYSDDFEFLDNTIFKEVAQECGMLGADLALRILKTLNEETIRARILKMTGLDGVEEALFFDPTIYTDSITHAGFHQLLEDVQDSATALEFYRHGQAIRFEFTRGYRQVLVLDVPFTINKNGAWISGDYYEGARYHAKERTYLSYGQRRPKKSKELATSVNTWVDFMGAGIFV